MIEKAKIRCIVDSALLKLTEHDRLSDAEKTDFLQNFDESNLRIGIVGKMKAGKSSLVNAFVFNDNILPSGSEPITVTLTEITYGEENAAEVELLTKEDIDALRVLASRVASDESETQLIESAKGVLESLPNNYEQLMTKGKITVPISELTEFVSTSGKLSGLAKCVRISLNADALKGITIIDTPGFNDPISSRGETTKKCLANCNVLIFVHSHNGYDQVDASLLSSQIEYAGISELIDVYNKVDLLHLPLSEWDDQLDYFIERRDEYLKKIPQNSNVATIMSKSASLMTSSLMALCGQIPSKNQSPFFKSNKSKFEEEYEELTSLDDGETIDKKLIEISNIEEVVSHIDRISKSSASYLMEAPLITLKGKLEAVIRTVQEEISTSESKIKTLSEKVESAEREKDAVAAFFDGIKANILVNNLSSELSSEVSSSFRTLCNTRSTKAKDQFNESNYPDPSFFSSGVTKHNLGQYNLLVSDYENDIRNALDALKSSLRTRSIAYVNKLRLSLVSSHITKSQGDYFVNSLTTTMNSTIDELNVLISSHSITELPDGNLNHWAILKKKFEDDFNDEYISELLAPYQERANSLGTPSTMLPTLSSLRSELLNALSATPAEREREKKAEEEHLTNLKKEESVYKALLSEIKNLMK